MFLFHCFQKVRKYLNHSISSPKYIPYSSTPCNGNLLSRDNRTQTFNTNYGNGHTQENNDLRDNNKCYEFPLRDIDARSIEQRRDKPPTFFPSKSSPNEDKPFSE